MQEKVLNILNKSKNAITTEELCSQLSNLTTNQVQEVQKILNEMVQKGDIYFTNKGKYILFDNCEYLKRGKLQLNKKGFGFLLVPDGEDIHIERNSINGAIDGDIVIVEVLSKHPKLEGRVLKIVERNLNNLVGEVKNIHGKMFLLQEKAGLTIELDKTTSKSIVDGMIVVAEIIKEKIPNFYLARVTNIIGHKDDAGVDILEVAYKHEIYPEFSKRTLQEIEEIPDEVSPNELYGRTNLTGKMIFTIDGADTKDIDDAISLERKGQYYKLGVHIADVSNYVKENMSLNEDALNKGTSSYLADTVIPMLPHKLSNGICSLNEGEIRLTISCEMLIDIKGKIVNYDIFPSYIKSKKKMTYSDVNDIIMRNKIVPGYEPYIDTLKAMNELAHILRLEKISRGYIDFDLDEAKIYCDENGRAVDVQRRLREDGEKLIEDFMIAANETVATAISNLDLPFIYRVHDKPSEEKITDFVKLVSVLGYTLKGKLKNITPKRMQELLESLKDKPEYEMLSSTLLRCMRKAKYDIDNIGHFGLASSCYTHFTSPIRRYPDLEVHRLLRKYLFEHSMEKQDISDSSSKIEAIAIQSSDRELKAIEAEREVDDMKMAEYMEGHIGEEYDGKISGLTNFGMFIELDNLIEGLVHISTLKGDYFEFNEKFMAIIGKSTKKMYRLGEKVRIKVVMANKQNRTIDFELVKGKDKDGNTK